MPGSHGRSGHFWGRAALVFLLLWLGFSTVYRVAWDDITHTDYTVYRVAAQTALQGGDIYTVQNERGWNYVYPPPFALLLAPLAVLPLSLGALLWYLLELAAIVAGSLMCLRLLQPPARAADRSLLLGLPLLSLAVILVSGTMRCQASGFVTVCVFAAIYGYFRERSLLAATGLAVAIVIKVFPATLLVFFASRGRWSLVGLTLALVLLMLALPSLYWGWDKNLAYIISWVHHVAMPALADNAERAHGTPLYRQLLNAAKPRNHSLQALFLSANLGPVWSSRAANGVAGLMLLPMLWLAPRARDYEAELVLAAAFVVWQLLIPPISESHYFGMLVLPLTLLLGHYCRDEIAPRHRRVGIASLTGLMLLATVLTGWRYTELLRPLCLASLGVWGMLIYRLVKLRAHADSQSMAA